MGSSRLDRKVRRFARLVIELFPAIHDLGDVPGRRIMIESNIALFEIAKHLSRRYGNEDSMADDGDGNWLSTSQGPDDVPMPPALESDRLRDLAGRALLTPAEMTRAEIQEIAASVISHIAGLKP